MAVQQMDDPSLPAPPTVWSWMRALPQPNKTDGPFESCNGWRKRACEEILLGRNAARTRRSLGGQRPGASISVQASAGAQVRCTGKMVRQMT